MEINYGISKYQLQKSEDERTNFEKFTNLVKSEQKLGVTFGFYY